MAIGPIQLIAIGFDEPEFRGAIRRELAALRGLGLVRLIDALFVAKDDFGGMTRMEMSDLSESEKMEFGALIGGMIGLGAGDWETAELGAELGALAASENVFGVSGEEISAFVEDLEPGTAAALLLLEHQWAIGFRDAVLDAGGEFLLQGYLTPDTLFMFGAELEAQAEAAAAIEAAEEAVADLGGDPGRKRRAGPSTALITAGMIEDAAMDEAAEVVADALAIGFVAEAEAEAAVEEAEDVEEAAAEIEAAAIVDVIRTLLAAELIEDAAIDDVVDTLVAAGMIEEEAAEEAVAAILAADDIEEAAADDAAEAIVEAEEIEDEV